MTEATPHVRHCIHTDCIKEINTNSNVQNISQSFFTNWCTIGWS